MLKKLFSSKRKATSQRSRSISETLLVDRVLTAPGVDGKYLFDALLRIHTGGPEDVDNIAVSVLDCLTDIEIHPSQLFLHVLEMDEKGVKCDLVNTPYTCLIPQEIESDEKRNFTTDD